MGLLWTALRPPWWRRVSQRIANSASQSCSRAGTLTCSGLEPSRDNATGGGDESVGVWGFAKLHWGTFQMWSKCRGVFPPWRCPVCTRLQRPPPRTTHKHNHPRPTRQLHFLAAQPLGTHSTATAVRVPHELTFPPPAPTRAPEQLEAERCVRGSASLGVPSAQAPPSSAAALGRSRTGALCDDHGDDNTARQSQFTRRKLLWPIKWSQ